MKKRLILDEKLFLEENELRERARRHRRKQKGLGYFVKLNGGDVEKGIECFNHAMGADTSSSEGAGEAADAGAAMGEGYSDDQRKQQLFKEIQEYKPDADFENYKNFTLNQLLAVKQRYANKAARNKKKAKITFFEPKLGKIYQDPETGYYRIENMKGDFPSYEDAEEYIKDNE